jgi:hypothetical protein
MKKVTFGFVAIMAVGAAGLVGWVLNIITVVSMVSEPITKMFILRAVGIFAAPLGAVLGYL